jgi:ligand-binding sensor domain-containing protein
VFPGQTNKACLYFDRAHGLPSDWVVSLWEDRENNLWCGTGAGLVVIRPNNLNFFDEIILFNTAVRFNFC